MGKFALYTIGFALLACVPAILLAGMFSGGGGDVAPFLLGMLAVGAVLAGAVCLKDSIWPDLRLCDTLNLYRGPYPASPPQYPA